MTPLRQPSPRARLRVGARPRARGVTLIELMIAMVLGLVVVGGVISILLANQRTYRTTEALSQVQESARTAFELVARDVRQTGATGCDNSGRIANVLNPGTTWWQTWFGITGYDGDEADPAVATGTATTERVAGTDSMQLQGLEGTGLSVEDHDPAAANFKINATTTSLVPGDVVMVCDFDHATLFQVTNYNSSNVTLVHNTGTETPGNCSKGLGFPTVCTTLGNAYKFGPNSQIARFAAIDWYVGNNGRANEGGRSLYRRRLDTGGVLMTEEVVAGVTNMQVRYRLNNTDSFADASGMAASDWAKVNAIAVTLTMDSADRRVSTDASVNSGRLQRRFTNLITLRNRAP